MAILVEGGSEHALRADPYVVPMATKMNLEYHSRMRHQTGPQHVDLVCPAKHLLLKHLEDHQ